MSKSKAANTNKKGKVIRAKRENEVKKEIALSPRQATGLFASYFIMFVYIVFKSLF